MKNPLIVALDVDEPRIAYKLAEKLHSSVGGFKVGPRLSLRADPSFFRELSRSTVLFWDHKYFDIPTTTVSAVEAAAELGAHWVTVHGTVGSECMRILARAQANIRESNPLFRIICVTVLTSFTKETLPPTWVDEPISKSVQKLAFTASTAGLTSLVCSADEISLVKKINPDFFLVVPGIRPPGSPAGDQRRVATPAEALKAGANALVIGRPIVESSDPIETVRSIGDSIKEL